MPGIQSKTRLEMVAAAGRFFQLLGLPRSTGQVYGLLFLSDQPLSLAVMAQKTGLSKGSVSIATRHLAAWGAARTVWVQGARQDHFEAVGELAVVVEKAYRERVRPRIKSTRQRIELIQSLVDEDETAGHLDKAGAALCRKRLKAMESIHRTLRRVAPLAEKFLNIKPARKGE